jgi:hypothetical protein
MSPRQCCPCQSWHVKSETEVPAAQAAGVRPRHRSLLRDTSGDQMSKEPPTKSFAEVEPHRSQTLLEKLVRLGYLPASGASGVPPWQTAVEQRTTGMTGSIDECAEGIARDWDKARRSWGRVTYVCSVHQLAGGLAETEVVLATTGRRVSDSTLQEISNEAAVWSEVADRLEAMAK